MFDALRLSASDSSAGGSSASGWHLRGGGLQISAVQNQRPAVTAFDRKQPARPDQRVRHDWGQVQGETLIGAMNRPDSQRPLFTRRGFDYDKHGIAKDRSRRSFDVFDLPVFWNRPKLQPLLKKQSAIPAKQYALEFAAGTERNHSVVVVQAARVGSVKRLTVNPIAPQLVYRDVGLRVIPLEATGP
jgi:hypothetical protein